MAAFFIVNRTAEALKEAGSSGSYILNSGIYPVTVNFISVITNEHNARSLNFNVTYEGTENTLYGLTLDNNDGTPNYQQAIFNKLAIIAGLEVVNAPVPETHNLGKDKTPTDLLVLSDFSGLDIMVKVQEENSLYKGELKTNRRIKGFYDARGATAGEIENSTPIGVQLEKDRAYENDITYKDNLTAEKVAPMRKAQEEARKAGKEAPKGVAPQVVVPAKNLFAAK